MASNGNEIGKKNIRICANTDRRPSKLYSGKALHFNFFMFVIPRLYGGGDSVEIGQAKTNDQFIALAECAHANAYLYTHKHTYSADISHIYADCLEIVRMTLLLFAHTYMYMHKWRLS